MEGPQNTVARSHQAGRRFPNFDAGAMCRYGGRSRTGNGLRVAAGRP